MVKSQKNCACGAIFQRSLATVDELTCHTDPSTVTAAVNRVSCPKTFVVANHWRKWLATEHASLASRPPPWSVFFLKVCEGIDRAGKCEPAPGRSSASPPQAENFGILGSKLQCSLIRGTLCNVLWGLFHKKKHCWRSSSTQKNQKNPPHFWFFWFFSKPFWFFLSGDTPHPPVPPRPSK